jgi:predicted nucleic acid-binding protein
MVLVDTSVWVVHLRDGSSGLAMLLNDGEVMIHSFVIGELACGNIKNRKEILSLLQALPRAAQAQHEEVLGFIEQKEIMGRGVGYIDIHLLASAILSDAPLWTLDKNLAAVAGKMKINYTTK